MSYLRTLARTTRNQPIATVATSTVSTDPAVPSYNSNDTAAMTQRSAASTSAAHRVPHRVTVRKTAYQVQRLQEVWAQTHTPTKEQREQLADEIGLETRIVSTWFRDERSKITRANAERARLERATVGPIRNTRTSQSTAPRFRSEVDAEDDEEDDEETLDRHTKSMAPITQLQPQTRASPHSRYAPYGIPNSTAIDNVIDGKKPVPRHFDPLIRASVPIDAQPSYQLAMDTHSDADSYDYPSPAGTYMSTSRQPLPPQSQRPVTVQGPHANLRHPVAVGERLTRRTAFARQSLPAPSISSNETSEDEDELEEDHEGALAPTDERPREFSPRTPGLVPSTIPSPRVIQPSSSPNVLPPISSFVTNPDLATSPRAHDVFLGPTKGYSFPAKSPYTTAITLPTQSGGTYTFQPLPVIIGQLPKRDSNWRFGYYDKVSSMRHTLGDRLHHADVQMEDSDASDEESDSEHALSANNSPVFRPAEMRTSLFGGLFGGKKQLFVDSATDPSRMV